jgi:RHS repeat-associated protein
VRSGGISQTSLNYTGQRLDGTGLVYYHARSYDPVLGRFISADTIVPGMAEEDGSGVASLGYDGHTALTPLTVDFHAPEFVAQLHDENAFRRDKGFWFQLGDDDRQEQAPWGPINPQALNRYSYVLNNPLRWTDPSGHWTFSIGVTFRAGLLGGGSVSVGVTWDSRGNVKLYNTTSVGVTVGYYLGASVNSAITTAHTIAETEGEGVLLGIGGGYLGAGGIDIINPGGKYVGISPSIGIGYGAEWHLEGAKTTFVRSPGPGRDPCVTRPGYCGDSGVPAPTPTPVTPVPITPTPADRH